VGLLNMIAWWFLSPLGWTTHGLAGFILNGIVFVIAAHIVNGLKVSGCIMAAIASLCVTFVLHVLERFVGPMLQ
jgi:uncharacterized membrane protein YvlD (DUF360 family)